MEQKKVYYAHSMHLYSTAQETRDIVLLEGLGFEVVNPDAEKHRRMVESIKDSHHRAGIPDAGSAIMTYFEGVVYDCHVLAFRGYTSGKIPAGVWKEIQAAIIKGKPVIELPVILPSRKLSVEETRAILHYEGQR